MANQPTACVSIATGYGLDDLGIESRWGEVYRTCPEQPLCRPNLLYNGHGSLSWGVNPPGRGVDHSHSYSSKVKERVELYIYIPSGSSLTLLEWTSRFTKCLQQNLSRKTKGFSDNQEFTLILCNLKIYHHINKSGPPVPIRSQANPVTPHPHTTFWRTIVIFSSHLLLGLTSTLFPSCFPTKILHIPLLSLHSCHMPHPSQGSWFDHPNHIWWHHRAPRNVVFSTPMLSRPS